MDVGMFGCLEVWRFGCLEVWMFGCLEVWRFAPRYIPHAGHSEHSGTSLGELARIFHEDVQYSSLKQCEYSSYSRIYKKTLCTQ